MANGLTAVIGGTGFDNWEAFTPEEAIDIDTCWGPPSAEVIRGQYNSTTCLFLPRHGRGHRIPPHRINYRANIRSLTDAGATRIIAIAAVGGIRDDIAPGRLALPDQIIDYTWGRPHTYWDGTEDEPLHIDFTRPFSDDLRTALHRAAAASGVPLIGDGTYGVTQGPRLETAAEIGRMQQDGCDMVGMTIMPEAALALEAGLDYACIAVSVNWAAGLGDSGIHDEIQASLSTGMAGVHAMLAVAIPSLQE